MRLVHHDVHREEMQMARLTVTLDDSTSSEVDRLGVAEWRDVLERAMDALPIEESMYLIRLARSLEELGESPSSSAVVRQALQVYLGLLQETKELVELQNGYAMLALDPERQEVIEVMSKRAPGRWDAEG